MKASINILLSHVFLVLLVSLAYGQQAIQQKYSFVTEPPPFLNCNPYNSRVNLECNVVGPNFQEHPDDEPEFTISWFRMLESTTTEELLDGQSLPGVNVDIQTSTIEFPASPSLIMISSTIELTLRVSNESQGYYWCQIAIEEGINMYKLLQKSIKTNIESSETYLQDAFPDCRRRNVYLQYSQDVLTFLGDQSIISTCSPSSSSTTSTSSAGGAESDDFLIPLKWLIVIGCVGGSLLLMSVALLITLICICGGKKKAVSKRRKRLPPAVPEKPVSRQSSTVNIMALETPDKLRMKSPPQIPTPVLSRGGARTSLPTRLPHRVNGMQNEASNDQYAPVPSRRDRRAATLIDKLKTVCDQPAADGSTRGVYRGLDHQMMDDIQPYDSMGTQPLDSGSDDDDDDQYTQPHTINPRIHSASSDNGDGDATQHMYTEPDTTSPHIRDINTRPLTGSVDGEYVYPNNPMSFKPKISPTQEDYMALCTEPDTK